MTLNEIIVFEWLKSLPAWAGVLPGVLIAVAVLAVSAIPVFFVKLGDAVERKAFGEEESLPGLIVIASGLAAFRRVVPVVVDWWTKHAGWYFGYDFSESVVYGWYGGNNGGKTHPVGLKCPNGWGLFDMHGNVWERCRDWYGTYPTNEATDPVDSSSGSDRVNRGGSWSNNASYCRSADRGYFDPGLDFGSGDLGVRVALAAAQ
nr:SUMF1/EgtB/PvdO family nonheme iron enzyme [Schwartzia sp. (in: firmicutes)]